ncbi:secretin N-terminal domain-containing protein [Prosthecobacter vanneervenii]|uniref:Type II secretion system protein D n=1 Tax=Prosthecobacter vanneervenii TaxID=48466 RepID=A0A7W7YCF7_9BACT|nr:secretin N-terminal domain-containing protein [Prosthecobacter vanneervenii]MBB5033611.1 type II secretion system protein D [Prosthecobacter vanneervenii]
MSHHPSQLPARLRTAMLLVLLILGMRQASKAQTPGAVPTAPLPAAQPGNGGYVPVGEGATIKVNFPSAPIQAIIPFYTQLTGKKLILDSALQGEMLRIISPQMLTKKDAVAFIEATLLLNGYAIINVDATTAKLINHAGGKSPTADGLKVYNVLHDLPLSEEICHYVLPLQHLSAEEASKAFQQVIKLHSYGAMTPVSNDTALIITENSATIRSICDIAQIIDVPPTETSNEMIKLERSDVEQVAEIVNEIFEQEEKSKMAKSAASNATPNAAAVPNPTARPGAPAVPASPAGSTAATNPAGARVKVFPYRRTNELLVIGRPVDIAYIKGLVQKLDKQSDGSNFLKRRLKYLDVLDFLPVAYNALAKDTDIQGNNDGAVAGAPGGSGGGRRRTSASSNSPSTDANRSSASNSNNGSGFNSSGFGSGNGLGGIFGNSGGQGGSNPNRSLLDNPEDVGAPESMVVGKTLLIADPQSNSLIVSGSPEHIDRIDQLLQEMDVRPQQIYISAIIGQLSLGKNLNYGMDFLQLLNDFSVNRNGAVTTSTGGTTTTTNNNIIQFPAKFGQLNFYGQLGSLSNYIKVINNNNNFKVLATPSIYAKNAAKSVISSGQRIAVPANILTNGGFSAGVANTSVSVTYRDVVLKLEVIPLINSDHEVTLRIAQINDNIVGSQTIGGNTVPTIGTQELVTEVAVKNGATVVLGGLITEKTTKNKNGVIGLSRIPVLGHLFGTTQDQTTRDELLVFIQPRIVRSDDPLDASNEVESTRSRIYDEAMQFSGPDLQNVPRALPARD